MTRDEMVTYVLNRALISASDSDRVSQIESMLGESHKRLVAEHGLIQTTASLAFTADDSEVDLPSDWARTRSIKVGDYVLRELGWQEFSNLKGSYEQPLVYAMDGPNHIRLYPAPTATTATGATIWYDAYPSAMGADDEPEGIPAGFHEILPELVLSRVMLAEEEMGLSAAAMQLAQDMIGRMTTLVNRRGGQFSTQIPVPGLFAG